MHGCIAPDNSHNRYGKLAAGCGRQMKSSRDGLRGLWTDAGLERIEARVIHVRRGFGSAEDFWRTSTEQACCARPSTGWTPARSKPCGTG